MDKLNNILNDGYENKNWFSRNYFWAGTVFVVLLCNLLYMFGGNHWNPIKLDSYISWSDGLNFSALLYGFFHSFGHSNLQHTLLNMLCFLIVGLYLERKTGTIKLLLLVIGFAFLSTGIIAAMSGGVGSIGYSGVNFAFYFYIIIDFIFVLFLRKERTKSAVILGIIMFALIYLAMCFNGGTTSFGFEWYPWDLMHNQGHTGGAVSGIIVALIVNIAPLGKKTVNT